MTTKKSKIRPPFKIFGGKYYLSQWIVENFPENYEEMDYVEPFCGAASVFLNKNPSNGNEIINDLDPNLIKIFKALRDEPSLFIKKVKNTTYSERVFKREQEKNEFEDLLSHALNEFILRRMSRSGLKKAFGWSDRQRGGQPGDVNAWKTIAAQLPVISERLQKTRIYNKPAIEIIDAYNEPNVLIYADPPYLETTRVSPKAYDKEMTIDDHIKLSDVLKQCNSKVIVSGYPSMLYNNLYKDWNCVKKQIPNHASQQKTKTIKTEVLLKNY